MRGWTAVVVGCCVFVTVVACFMAGILWLTLPPDRLSAHIPGLSSPVSISLDLDGIPRVSAATETDGAAALGFLHARERLFQMELMRRAASGRLSEIAGPSTLRLDRMMRTLGLRQSARADLKALPEDTSAILEAYARGVNAWIQLRGRLAAPEFLFLGQPEPWEPIDSLLWAKTMGLWLSMNWRQELARLALADRLSADKLDQLWPRQSDVPRTDALAAPVLRHAAVQLASALPAFPGVFTLPQTASNEWAVDGRHTATGAPLLAGDPHLSFNFPGLWYLARINTPGHVLAGATAPGVPFLVLGHNGKIAWTFTSAGADVQDIFVEVPVGDDMYQTPGGPRPFETREERIAVRGQPEQQLVVRQSRHGPVISDLDQQKNGPILAVAMVNLQPNDTAAAGLLALNRAVTVEQAKLAAEIISSPVQNLLVADRAAIGVFTTGRVPIRASGDGAAPVVGDGSHDWVGWASGSTLPNVIAPKSGRLVNANEPMKLSSSDVFMGHDYFGSWRSDRIRQLLNRSDWLTATDFVEMQSDVVNLFARSILPVLVAIPVSDGPEAIAVRMLTAWDGSSTMSQPQPLIFAAWMNAFVAAVLHNANLPTGLGAPVADFISFVLSPEGANWCGGDCTPILKQSLEAAMRKLQSQSGSNPSQWQWGKAHPAVFAHPLLRNLPLLDMLTTISISTPGDNDTIDRGGYSDRFEAVEGPSYRGVYDLSDLDRSLFMLAPGQSGHILSRHARDFLTRWRDGATITLGPEVQTEAGHIDLTP